MFTNFIYVASVYFTIGMNSTTNAADCVAMATVYVLIYATLLDIHYAHYAVPGLAKRYIYMHIVSFYVRYYVLFPYIGVRSLFG